MKRVLQDGAGYSGVLVIQGDKRIPSAQVHLQRNGRVADLGFSEWIFPFEYAFLKTRQAFEPSAAVSLSLKSLVIDLQNREWSFDKFGNGRSALNMQNGKTSLGGSVALRQGSCRGMIPDGKILQTAVTIKTNTASPDSSQGHRDLGRSVASEVALGSVVEEFFR